MKILFFGDVIGQVGREGLTTVLPVWRRTYQPDFVIANAENAAHGKGITPKTAEELWDSGVDVLTMGNHTFDRKEIGALVDDPRLLRPANYPAPLPGHGSGVYNSRSGNPIAVLQLMGRVYMPLLDCPFQTADQVIPKLREQAKVIIVDLHAEITSEKSALGWYMDGRVSAVIGSHTHVQTADERILPGGTAFLTDVGACGPQHSIIGMDIQTALKRFRTGIHQPMTVATGDALVCGCLLDVDEQTGQARSIERLRDLVPISSSERHESIDFSRFPG
jgi:2',3'-cyclic-nucleotide 2'-phosphodiesterase